MKEIERNFILHITQFNDIFVYQKSTAKYEDSYDNSLFSFDFNLLPLDLHLVPLPAGQLLLPLQQGPLLGLLHLVYRHQPNLQQHA